jgi:restriction endonuclease S subunit
MRIKAESAVYPDYLVWYINHFRAQKYFLKHLTGSALPHINRQVLEELPVIVPPLLGQEQIVSTHRCRLKEKI